MAETDPRFHLYNRRVADLREIYDERDEGRLSGHATSTERAGTDTAATADHTASHETTRSRQSAGRELPPLLPRRVS